MNERSANETVLEKNPYPESTFERAIRPRMLIRCLGASVGVLGGLPAVIALIMFLANPIGTIRELHDGTIVPYLILAVQLFFVFMTWRWLTIQAVLTQKFVRFRGWFRTLTVSLKHFGSVRKVWYESYSPRVGQQKKWKYEVRDQSGNYLGTVPASMHFCKDWDDFLRHLNQIDQD